MSPTFWIVTMIAITSCRLSTSFKPTKLFITPLKRYLLTNKDKKTQQLFMSSTDIKRPIEYTNTIDYNLSEVKIALKNGDLFNNVPESVRDKVGTNLHLQLNHPLNIIKKR